MFWKKKKKPKAKPSREEIIAQAQKVAAAKTEEIGDETLEKIRAAMFKKENSAMEQAKRQIMAADDDKVRDNLKYLLRDKE